MASLKAMCEITVIDFSPDRLAIQKFDNDSLGPFLQMPQPAWSRCRWVNVNGLSWDVIQALGRYKNLHKLAIEDLMNTRNRTKAEWFPSHCFIILTLQKLVHSMDALDLESAYDSDSATIRSDTSRRVRRARRAWRKLARWFGWGDVPELNPETGKPEFPGERPGFVTRPSGFSDVPNFDELRTLQRYHSGPGDPRIAFMERHSALGHRDLAVACEQVSMFITSDNTIISFFEQSAQEIERPIVRRLQTIDTIIRQSCDASMVGQAIMDDIIDLAIPVTACYGDVIADLEMDVLTKPTLTHTKRLYIVITEVNKLLGFINPIVTLINALRDHKSDLSQEAASQHLQSAAHGVIVTPLTATYLGDVLDHAVLITETLTQLRGSAEGMIGLIFNTISAGQNESMRQLTAATIIFLPLTFITGYFGQNFEPFTVLKEDVGYFWKIAIPVVVATFLLLQSSVILAWFRSKVQKRYIERLKITHRLRKVKRR
ncbi:hypothetical protein B0T18DRAFT_441064 [Schizothecium vesticola]|uniref:Uncharacterized protein n=1 Tax=Schizothecium vesticola TaxID=314040 RepID=A0AA40BQ74_9PEZI|nr:hypothetical protein B0T18DRAFT_441064 [Schizothecium vesticola]